MTVTNRLDKRLGLSFDLPTIESASNNPAHEVLATLDFQINYTVQEAWSHDSDNAYYADIDANLFELGGQHLDVMAVRSEINNKLRGQFLQRVESIALCKSTNGSYFFDSQASYDDTDDYRVYVHLPESLWSGGGPTGNDPNNFDISVRFGIPVSTDGIVLPTLYDSTDAEIVNGDMESWASATDLNNWSENSPGTTSINRESTIVYEGSFSANINSDGLTADPVASIYNETIDVIEGNLYRVSGVCYMSQPGIADIDDPFRPAILLRRVSDPSEIAMGDGRDFSAGLSTVFFTPTKFDQWFRFTFDYRAWFTGAMRVQLRAQTSGLGNSPSGDVYWDAVKHQAIARYQQYDARLSTDLPEITNGTSDPYFGGKYIGSATVNVLNIDKVFYTLLGQGNSTIIGTDVVLSIGYKVTQGASTSAREAAFDEYSATVQLPRDSYKVVFMGTVQDFEINDQMLTLNLIDYREALQREISPNTLEATTYPNIDPRVDGSAIPVLFGDKHNIKPQRIDLVGGSFPDYGIYIINDPEFRLVNDNVAGAEFSTIFGATLNIWTYTDEASADIEDANNRLLVQSFTINGDAGTIDIEEDCQLLRVSGAGQKDATQVMGNRQNNRFEYNLAVAGNFSLQLTAGVYTPDSLNAEIAVKSTLAGGPISGSYSDTTHKFTFTHASQNITLLSNTGGNKDNALWKTIGVDQTADQGGGATSVTTNLSIWNDVDTQHHIRIDSDLGGYADDQDGTYSGSDNTTITKHTDIMRYILTVMLGLDGTKIFNASNLDAARNDVHAMYRTAPVSVMEILKQLETGEAGEFIFESDVISFKTFAGSGSIETLNDEDYITFNTKQVSADIYSDVAVAYDAAPNFSNKLPTKRVSKTKPTVEFNRRELRKFDTMLVSASDAATLATTLGNLVDDKQTIYTITTPRLLNRRYSDRITLNRETGLGPTGTISSAVGKIIQITKNYVTGISSVTLLKVG